MSYRALVLSAHHVKAKRTYGVLSSFEDQACIIPPQLDLQLSRHDSRYHLLFKVLEGIQNNGHHFQILVPDGGLPEDIFQQQLVANQTRDRPVKEICHAKSVRIRMPHALLQETREGIKNTGA